MSLVLTTVSWSSHCETPFFPQSQPLPHDLVENVVLALEVDYEDIWDSAPVYITQKHYVSFVSLALNPLIILTEVRNKYIQYISTTV